MRSHIRTALQWLAPPLVVLVVAYLVLATLVVRNQEQLLFPGVQLPADAVYPFARPSSELALPVGDETLAAVLFEQPNPKGVVLYLHGNGETLLNAEVVADPLLDRGYNVLAIDYRGYGKSTGTIGSEQDLFADVSAAYQYLRQTYRDDQIIVYGRSLGSGLALHLATTVVPRLVILEAAYFSMKDLVPRRVPLIPVQFLKYPIRSDLMVGMVQSPIVLIHGTNDAFIPPDSSARLRALARAPSELVLIEGAGHNDVITFPAYHALLDRVLR